MQHISSFSDILKNRPILQHLWVLLIACSISFSSCEIKDTHIVEDSRPLILFERFGFADDGHVAISLKDVTWKPKQQKAELDHSSMGFFLARDPSLARIVIESEVNKSFCALSSRYVEPMFTFDQLDKSSSYNGLVSIFVPDEYSLVFGNCQTEFEVSMQVHTEMYNIQHGTKYFLPAGMTILPKLYFVLFTIYVCFFGVWTYVCIRQSDTVDKIHLIMLALLLVKALKMICASEDTMYVNKTGTPHGWDVAFYIFGILKGTMLFTVIILIGTGWSFLKPYLQEREKNVLMTVIPLQVLENVAYVIIDETGPATKDWMTWNQLFLLIDIICCFAVFFPIIWSIKSLQQASKTDGKAARNLEKLILFKQFYVCLVAYLYFTRVVVQSFGALLDYKYEWIPYAVNEGASLAFYVFIFYNFQPIEKNPYLLIDDEAEMAAAQMLEEHVSYEL
ncbi:hypothetical protein Tsubulata_003993 [Turnera subulata]|uniref:Uncharacterized protein n=1 Tax=Turnera subulata TaxID=218843 RepID=A0A9Q0FM20_9ROSI|nr:hypothetical protein Tsubulata_003993 [Turnera subulata]